ncbi:MAG: glycoside hydrolase family 2 TIM barrel-domain containing protein [Bryobacteraceae bacterium]
MNPTAAKTLLAAALSLTGASAWVVYSQGALPAGPIRTEIRKENGRFQLYRGGKPYLIQGVVYVGDMGGRFPLKDVAVHGANSIRSSGGRNVLDEAHRLGLSVLVNLPMRMESVHKFDYSDEKAVREQFERVKQRVLELKDHPAVLAWSIGNELSVGYTNKAVWNAVNDVARMIHETDPLHPTMTVIGDGSINAGDIVEIKKRAPDLDMLGINYYMHVETVPAKIRQYDWDKPYVLTEWGPSGDWQVPRTEWKASIEETSTEKAQRFLERYQNVVLKDTERCLGSYAFIWGWRHERTQTWYGMHLETGERTEAVNVMQFLWTGHWPANRAPRIEDLRLEGRRAPDNVYLKPGERYRATVQASDPDQDPIRYRWEILAEVARAGYAGMGEKRPAPMPELIAKAEGPELVFQAPPQEGAYRVFVFLTDGKGNGATANFPFYVRP